MKKIQSLITIIFFATITLLSCSDKKEEVPTVSDVVIYGGSSAGISAAIQAARLGNSVILIEPSNRLGGLTTGGLGQTDIGNKQVIGGIALEFYKNIRKYYSDSTNWVWQMQSEYKGGGQSYTDDKESAMWTFEPSVALEIYHKMMKDDEIEIIYNQRLDRTAGVSKTNDAITFITMESGEQYDGKMFIDATYEGDLLAAAGISYTVGREANIQYEETLNGVQANDTSRTLLNYISANARHHNFVVGVNPYIVSGDSSSGLLPNINPSAEEDGSADHHIQAYCFRMCLTDHPENRIPFEQPSDYQELNYELLFRNYEAGYGRIPWIHSKMPNRKTDSNNRDGFSTDFIGQNYDYPEASYEERVEIIHRHRSYQQGLMWSLANHPRIPQNIRDEVSNWGTCKDEFDRKDGWQQQLYIREARRMISDFVMAQKHCEGIEVVVDGIGMAAFGMDSHHTQRYVNSKGDAANEGNVEAHVKVPFPISYRSIVPKKEECSNLLVPVCLSASHIAFGSIRMEPVFMVLGQSAAIIAYLAIEEEKTVQELEYDDIRTMLIQKKQIIENVRVLED